MVGCLEGGRRMRLVGIVVFGYVCEGEKVLGKGGRGGGMLWVWGMNMWRRGKMIKIGMGKGWICIWWGLCERVGGRGSG